MTDLDLEIIQPDRANNKIFKRAVLQESKRLFGFAMSRSPQQLYEAAGSPVSDGPEVNEPQTYQYKLTQFVLDQYDRHENMPYVGNARSLFLSGLADSGEALEKSIDDHPFDVTFEQALAIARHPGSTQALAILAMRPESSMHVLLNLPGHMYRLSPSAEEIMTMPHVEAYRNGCPVAGTLDENGQDIIRGPEPVFNRFAPWAMEIAARALYNPKHLKPTV